MEKLEKNSENKSDSQSGCETKSDQAETQSRNINNTFTAEQGRNEQTRGGQECCDPTDSEEFSNSETGKGESVQPYKTALVRSNNRSQSVDNPMVPGIGSGSSEQTSSYSAILKKNIPEPQPPSPQLTPIGFYLLIFGDYSVDQAILNLDSRPIIMKPVEDHVCDNNLFTCVVPLPLPQVKNNLTYKYGFRVKGREFKIPIFDFKINVLSKEPVAHVEANTSPKRVRSFIHFDVFNFKEDLDYMSETVPRSVVFYLKWLLNFISNPFAISNILKQIENLDFTSLVTSGKSNVEEFVKWIVEQVSENSVTDLQRLYLCIVLGHLCKNSDLLPRGGKTTAMCDCLLQVLNDSYKPRLLPPSNLKTLENLATILVESSSSPSWLTLAAYFYPYLGIGFILGKKFEKYQDYTYDTEEYKKMIDMLLSHIEKIESKEQSAYQDLLDLVMKKAPSLNEALKLFEVSKVSCFFADDVEKLNFFVKFYEKQTASTENENVAAKLSEFYKIPEKIRHKMHDYLFQTLLEYAKSDEEFNGDDEEKFLQAIISERDLAMDQVFDVLMELSKSKSIRRLMMVPKILGNTCFTKSWRVMPYEKKVKLCESWVITNCVNGWVGRSVDGVDKVIAVYGAIDAIIRSSPMNIANSILVTDLSTEVERRFLKNEDAPSLLKALAEIKRYVHFVQESYKSNVKNILKKKPKKVLKESCTILMEHCSNRLAQELLSFILDIIDVQEIGKVGQIKENNFKNILGSCDIWIIFLKIPEIDNKKYRIGEKICRELDKRIKDGDISLGLLKDVDKKKEDVSMLCAILRNASGPPKYNQADIQKLILDHISRLMHVAEDSSKKIDMLTSAIECSSKIIEDVCAVPGIESVTESLNDLKKILRTGSVKDLEDETSWGDLLLFLSAAEDLRTVGNSLSFRTVAKRCLKKLSCASEEEQENAATPIQDFHSLITFLTTTAIEQFQEQWDRVFKDPKSLNAETMKTLLGIMKGEDPRVKELEMLETYFGEKFSPEIKLYIHDYMKYPHLLEQVQHFIAIRDIFGLEDIPNDTMTVLLQFQTVMENRNEPTPTSLHQSMENIKQIVSVFSGEELTGVIKELSTCRELLSFMEEIVDEDIRFLIDAVEEHSDQFVFESSVSDLIDVHGFLAPLIRKKNDKTLELQGFLDMLKKSCNGHKDIEGKIKQCSMNVNSLRGLYMSIANRGEMTKEIIELPEQRRIFGVAGRWKMRN
ncbi:uncharacterized protein LOC114520246 [Dendronephthya gigantea]|uniref:uncharacterized protein LOC114520246 n=1 Tax=Dendronephthya gigantea TaxID=151771 RepID=UPI00106B3D33|nr:uncharacterized protein LOC114520246 [Dendronephthya gigantea]